MIRVTEYFDILKHASLSHAVSDIKTDIVFNIMIRIMDRLGKFFVDLAPAAMILL